MTINLNNWLLALFTTLSLLVFFAPAAAAQTPEDCANEASVWYTTTYCEDLRGSDGGSVFGEEGVINNVLEVIIIVITITSVIMIVISGMRFVFSGGDPQSTSAARSGIIYALIGLAVALVAQSIVVFVLERL